MFLQDLQGYFVGLCGFERFHFDQVGSVSSQLELVAVIGQLLVLLSYFRLLDKLTDWNFQSLCLCRNFVSRNLILITFWLSMQRICRGTMPRCVNLRCIIFTRSNPDCLDFVFTDMNAMF